jgi:hypothetical protein
MFTIIKYATFYQDISPGNPYCSCQQGGAVWLTLCNSFLAPPTNPSASGSFLPSAVPDAPRAAICARPRVRSLTAGAPWPSSLSTNSSFAPRVACRIPPLLAAIAPISPPPGICLRPIFPPGTFANRPLCTAPAEGGLRRGSLSYVIFPPLTSPSRSPLLAGWLGSAYREVKLGLGEMFRALVGFSWRWCASGVRWLRGTR